MSLLGMALGLLCWAATAERRPRSALVPVLTPPG